MSVNTDYRSLLNQQRLNSANALLGSGATVIPGMDGNLLQQWAMRGANSAAYRKLLAAQETGTVKNTQQYTELMSDKYFNDNYDSATGKVTKATYKPDPATTATVDAKATAGDNLDSMRRLALAAINNSGALTSTHYDLFEQMRQKIANGLVKGSSTDDAPTVVEDATPASVNKNTDFHLLTDDQNFTVAGSKGEKNYSFSTGDSLQSIVAAINADSDATGVKAEWVKNADGNFNVKLTSTDTGKESFVRVDQNVGTLFADPGKSLKANGTDALTKETETVATGDDTQAAIAAGAYTGKLFGDQAFTLSGAKGSKDFSFANGTSVEDVAAAINAASSAIGVTAQVIYNNAGEAEGIGLLAEKAGSGQYIQVTQNKGDLFANEGKSVKVAGSSTTKNADGTQSITNQADLGKVTIDGKTYSFADLGPGGSASLAKNPDAALAVLDQALRDIYAGRAKISGFDPADTPMAGIPADSGSTAATNALEIGNYGSSAMTKWLANYLKETT